MTSAKTDCSPRQNSHSASAPVELQICGGSEEEQTALATRVLALLPEDYSVFVIQGRSTGTELESGAAQGILARLQWREQDFLLQQHGPVCFQQEERLSQAADLLLRLLPEPRNEHSWLAAGELQEAATQPELGRAELSDDGLQGVLQHWLSDLRQQTPLFGLVLAGGRSRRMGKDKTLLEYHGKPQREVACELLQEHCEQVFLSQRGDQQESENWSTITDRFADFGPMGGLLSAMHQFPEAAWLVAAADLPYLDSATLASLVLQRAPAKGATAFRSAHDGLPEPLCAIWEPRMRSVLHHFMGSGIYCPRKVLIKSGIRLLDLPQAGALDNMNHPEEYEAARAKLQGRND